MDLLPTWDSWWGDTWDGLVALPCVTSEQQWEPGHPTVLSLSKGVDRGWQSAVWG